LNKRWVFPQPLPKNAESELHEFTPVEQQILYMRGLSTRQKVDAFLRRHREDDHDPFLLRDMDKAVRRINRAVKGEEKIIIYGDYDVDGVTSTALLIEVISNLGGRVDHYIPDRFAEGYGLNMGAIASIAEADTKLLVTVDCGIRDAKMIEHASSLGVDVIVTDHHSPGSELPSAVAVVNAKQADDAYPFKDLAGVGLAYKLAQALATTMHEISPENVLDLVALGTVADVSRLRGENRRLVGLGLERLNNTVRPGLQELVKIARLSMGRLTAGSIGFMLGPRLNAAGRLGSAESALRLITTTDRSEAEKIASELDAINRKRQELTAKTVERAIEITLGDDDTPKLIFVADETFSEGIAGLAASRLTDRYYRPSFVANRGAEVTRGSARSIEGFNVAEALDQCAELLIRYGGHPMAGGFTLKSSRLEEFRSKLQRIAEDELAEEDLVPKLEIDAEVGMQQLGEGLLEFIDRLEPCGHGNRAPVLMTKNVAVMRKRTVGAEGGHLKLTLRKDGRSFDAIAFRKGNLAPELPEHVDIAFNFERNEYMGIRSMQLNVLDIEWEGKGS